MHAMETINRRTWRHPLALRIYRSNAGYINEGERKIMQIAAARYTGGRVLDIGVGGGRTTALLRPLGDAYTGIDYTPQMVRLARKNHPDRNFLHMDARNLSAFGDSAFDLVVFSYNGMDAVDVEGRRLILREVDRVLAPGGLFIFSTFHRYWHGFRTTRDAEPLQLSTNPLRLAVSLVHYALGMFRAWRFRPLEIRNPQHAVLLHPAHDNGIMVYATTVVQLQEQLRDAGFDYPSRLFDKEGEPIIAAASADIEYFHVMSLKPDIAHGKNAA